jgi:hypothetical protein
MSELDKQDFMDWAETQFDFGPSKVQRTFRLGYNKAVEALEKLEADGLIETTTLPYRYRLKKQDGDK